MRAIQRLRQVPAAPARTRRGLKAAGRPALEGLPADLSIGTKERVRALIAKDVPDLPPDVGVELPRDFREGEREAVVFEFDHGRIG